MQCENARKMRAMYKISLVTIVISLITAVSGIGQVSVTGRAFAEVVESVSVKSQAVTSFEISNTPDFNTIDNSESDLNHLNVNLGEIKISSGSNVGYNLIITPAKLSNSSGEDFNISPSLVNNKLEKTILNNGSQTIALKGEASLKQNQVSGIYQGSYTLILAYN